MKMYLYKTVHLTKWNKKSYYWMMHMSNRWNDLNDTDKRARSGRMLRKPNPFQTLLEEIWLMYIYVGYYEIIRLIKLRLDSVIADDFCIWLLLILCL